ncbi:HNH endonuclease [Planctomycetes bacterium TBK1r]|uniref:HNH nuclease domain-containing protein n=1 Tax=Stieleria magnilauensis TaxID=2527963 RepID=A0ABX5XZF0_9BACT|nr:hypothetical protein TBK1r_64430 [Planctomycetes bacterium TBK1r]
MSKNRIAIPKKIRETILKEFNHRCAICGTHKPTIHHVDDDPSNNDPLNLLPLCPNCHYLDQHDPTSPIDPRKLAIFRKHKDPLILSPQFEPLFRRLTFLLELEDSTFHTQRSSASAQDLVDFVAELKMGSFYSKRIKKLLYARKPSRSLEDIKVNELRTQWEDEHRSELLKHLTLVTDRVFDNVVELLRYQGWEWKPKAYNEPR